MRISAKELARQMYTLRGLAGYEVGGHQPANTKRILAAAAEAAGKNLGRPGTGPLS